jgi:hypothetical protein
MSNAGGMSMGTESATDHDWTAKVVDKVDHVVGIVREKAVIPLTTIARWIVYGLVAGALGLMALVLLAIGLVRALDVYTGEGNVWIAHLLTGGIFTLGGLFLWSKRSASSVER